MTLATSCPSCGTVFKVIEDQLKVSEGWVRCGHCHSVFNALEGLFDLGARPRSGHSRPMTEGLASGAGVLQETPQMAAQVTPPHDGATPADTPTRTPRSAVATSGLAAPSGFGAVDASDLPTEFVPPTPMAPTPEPEAVMVMPAPEDSVHERHELLFESGHSRRHPDFSDADTVFLAHDPQGSFDLGLMSDRPGEDLTETTAKVLEPRFDGDLGAGADDPGSRVSTSGPTPLTSDAGSGAPQDSDPAHWGEMDPAPSFVRHADRAARWSRPAVRATLLVGCVLAAAGVALQFGLMRRDLLAAQSPLAASVITPICEVVGCTIEPPRLLDALAVENSNMVKLTGVDGYRLQVMLRNRADHVVQAPSVELSLTDATGALVVRRVLQPADFQQASSLAAAAEGNWQLEFASSDRRVAGYTVAIFYP
jgi:predicted Zn finger-like uncharacterized protein